MLASDGARLASRFLAQCESQQRPCSRGEPRIQAGAANTSGVVQAEPECCSDTIGTESITTKEEAELDVLVTFSVSRDEGEKGLEFEGQSSCPRDFTQTSGKLSRTSVTTTIAIRAEDCS